MLGADIILEFCAVVGLIAYGAAFRAAQPAHYLHRCLAALLITLGVLFLARGLHSLAGAMFFAHVAIAAAVILPLMALLCAEAIQRQHAPGVAKLLVVAAPIVLIIWRIAAGQDPSPHNLIITEAFVLGGLLANALWVRSRLADSPSEEDRRFGQFFVVALLLALPFAATDFQNFVDLPVRMGAMGALIGVYLAVWVPTNGLRFRLVLLQLLAILVFALILVALGLPWFDDRDWTFLIRAWAAITGILLTAGILLKLSADAVRRRGNRFIEQFLACDTGSVDSFLSSAAMLPPFSDMQILGVADLADYDLAALTADLSGGKVISLRALKGSSTTTLQEQMIDILEHAGATHLCLATESPARLALFTSGPLVDEREIGPQVGLFARTVALIAKMESSC